MVYINTYIFNHFYLQYLVLLTMVPRNSAVLYCTGTSNPFTATDGPLFWSSGRQDAACTSSLLLPLLSGFCVNLRMGLRCRMVHGAKLRAPSPPDTLLRKP